MTSRGAAFTAVAHDNKVFFCETLSDSSPPPISGVPYGVLTVKVIEEWYLGSLPHTFARIENILELLETCPVTKIITPPKGFTPRAVVYHDTELAEGEYKVGSTLVFTYSKTTRRELGEGSV